ncbi:MAG TPA: glycoside hydrolase family 3 C-terminal domain-containing protein [Chloroflexia bacterium]|nr:glycoside hydrolase family 3 C-terminal domain-containing protein [Chloroflexia bacterium]
METVEAVEQQINNLLAQMTLEEKIALTIGRNFWSTHPVERLGVAPIAMNDGPHGIRKPQANAESEIGVRNSIPATCFPPAVTLAASWDIALAEEIGRALGEECQEIDVQVLLGPGVNIKRTPLGGRNFEYFSEDPMLAGEIGAAWVRGVQSQGVGTSLKHYACNNQEWERMTIDAVIDQRTLREIYLAAFERVVKKARPWTIMAAYNKVNGVYASENPQLLTQILKEEWGFEGVVVSDWGAVNEKGRALTAGLDLEMPGPGVNHTARLVKLVQNGQLEEAAIDRAAARVLRMILQGHAGRKTGVHFDRAAHHALARRAAAEATVLLKNEDNLLPLKPEGLSSVAVIGQFARSPRYQGAGSSQIVPTQLDKPLEELESWLSGKATVTYAEGYNESEEPDEALIQEAVSKAQQASVAIIVAGLPGPFESEGYDRTHIFMPKSHNRLIEEVCRVQPNTVLVLQNGSVVAMPWLSGVKAVVEVGLGGQAGGSAIVDVLSGKVNPAGKLAETFPERLEDTPAYINYPGESGVVRYGEGVFVGYRYYDKKKVQPLFPFGYGLSYTTFEYSGLKLNKDTFKAGETLEVRVSVRNSGERAGKEIVQLYVRSTASQYSRPVRELKAFAKVALEPGETKEVTLTLEERDFMVYDSERQAWRMEGGSYQIEVGPSSAELPLSAAVTVQEDLASARRRFTRMTELKYFVENEQALALIRQNFGSSGDVEQWITNADEMFLAIPIIKIAGFQGISEEQVDAFIAHLNQAS